MSEPDLKDPKTAAEFAIAATQAIAATYQTKIMPAMRTLRDLHRRTPRADAPDLLWGFHFQAQDALENTIMDGLHEVDQLQISVVAATLPHVVSAYVLQPTSTADRNKPWQVAGHWANKAATAEAIESLAKVGFHWGNGFANPGSEM